MRRFSLIAQASYSELVASLADEEPNPWRDGGSLVRLEVQGKGYWYHQTKVGGRIHKRSIGPDSPELQPLLSDAKHAIEAARERRAGRRTLVRALRASFYPTLDPLSGRVMAALAAAGVFRSGSVLVGTQAFRAYPAMLGVRLPAAAALTADIDLGQTPRATGPRVKPGAAAILRGVDRRFEPVLGFDRPPHATRWRLPSGELSVDLITPWSGRGSPRPRAIPQLDAHAMPVRFLDYLLRDPVPAALLWQSGIFVTVPSPARYALHKLMVAERRNPTEHSKTSKDLAQTEALLDVLLSDQPEELAQRWSELRAKGPAWRKAADASLRKLPHAIREALEE
ncbi:MAG: GSU2403 family nucleotidyltransferase fold protein [Myxococcota bacterium]